MGLMRKLPELLSVGSYLESKGITSNNTDLDGKAENVNISKRKLMVDGYINIPEYGLKLDKNNPPLREGRPTDIPQDEFHNILIEAHDKYVDKNMNKRKPRWVEP